MKPFRIIATKCTAAATLVVLYAIQYFFKSTLIKIGFFTLMFVVFAAAWLIVGLMRARARADHQKVRNRAARALMSLIRANEPVEDLVLFLRPFNAAGEPYVDLEHSPEGNFSFEIYVTEALERRKLQVICVSGSWLNEGAGPLEADERNWREIVVKLISAAKIILVNPASTEGCLWELERIVQSACLNKTIFVVPPTSSLFAREPTGEFRESFTAIGTDWVNLTAAAQKLGLEFPKYSHEGLIFRFLPGGKVCALSSRWLFKTHNLAEAIVALAEAK